MSHTEKETGFSFSLFNFFEEKIGLILFDEFRRHFSGDVLRSVEICIDFCPLIFVTTIS